MKLGSGLINALSAEEWDEEERGEENEVSGGSQGQGRDAIAATMQAKQENG